MPEIIPIRDLKNTNAISQRCHETQEPIFVTKSGYRGYGYHEHKGSSDVVRGVFIYGNTAQFPPYDAGTATRHYRAFW